MLVTLSRPLLASVPLLRGGGDGFLDYLARFLEHRLYMPGDVLATQGTRNDETYFIVRGCVLSRRWETNAGVTSTGDTRVVAVPAHELPPPLPARRMRAGSIALTAVTTLLAGGAGNAGAGGAGGGGGVRGARLLSAGAGGATNKQVITRQNRMRLKRVFRDGEVCGWRALLSTPDPASFDRAVAGASAASATTSTATAAGSFSPTRGTRASSGAGTSSFVSILPKLYMHERRRTYLAGAWTEVLVLTHRQLMFVLKLFPDAQRAIRQHLRECRDGLKPTTAATKPAESEADTSTDDTDSSDDDTEHNSQAQAARRAERKERRAAKAKKNAADTAYLARHVLLDVRKPPDVWRAHSRSFALLSFSLFLPAALLLVATHML